MVKVHSSIEIAASPAKVREVVCIILSPPFICVKSLIQCQFLDFAKYPDWAQTHIKSISVSAQKDKNTLQAGDTLKVQLAGMTFSPIVNVRPSLSFIPSHLS